MGCRGPRRSTSGTLQHIIHTAHHVLSAAALAFSHMTSQERKRERGVPSALAASLFKRDDQWAPAQQLAGHDGLVCRGVQLPEGVLPNESL